MTMTETSSGQTASSVNNAPTMFLWALLKLLQEHLNLDESKQRIEIEKRAAQLVRDKEQSLSNEDKTALMKVANGQWKRDDLRTQYRWLFDLVGEYYGMATLELQNSHVETADPRNPTVWEFVAQWLLANYPTRMKTKTKAESQAFEDETKQLCLTDFFSNRKRLEQLEKLDESGKTAELLAAIRQRYPADAEAMGLTQPIEGKDKSPPPYLGVELGDREARRVVDGDTKTAEFRNKEKPWLLFKRLLATGETGVHRHDLEDEIGGSLDHHKTTVGKLIGPLKLKISLKHGIWTLKEW